jgi:cation diffusion facilitator CzcD-associated flavoprotein CzcO
MMDQDFAEIAAAPRAARSRDTLRIAIVGAGFGGIGLAILLKQAGFGAITLFEKAGSIGGTWRDNAYPGAACDVPSHLYSFSFAPKSDWTHRFSGQAEILAYLHEVAARYGIDKLVRPNQAVQGAAFNAADLTWSVETADGAVEKFDIFIPAVGQLAIPSVPTLPGLEDFAGPHFHSARWDYSIDLAGKRVGVVGSAASAVQFIPELAKICAQVSVFQRTPNWVIPRNNIAYSETRKKLFGAVPLYRHLMRQYLYLYGELLFFGAFKTGSWRAALVRKLATDHLKAQVPDPVLRAKLTPDYVLGCKRILITDDYLPCFSRDHVELVTEKIDSITPTGIRTADGQVRDFDALVFATGFDVRNCLTPVSIKGRYGIDLHHVWRDGPEAYLGIAMPGFPNMLIMYGPNTSLGHSSIILMLECQARYIVQCLERLVAADLDTLEVSAAAHARFNKRLQAELGRMVWTTGCASWYGQGGRITANWSGSTLEYGRRMKRVDFGDFVLEPRRADFLSAPSGQRG